MRSLVIGGLGFVGSHLVEGLKKRGDYVAVLDNGSQTRIKPSETPADAVYFEHVENIWYTVKGQWDVVYHCASPAGPARIRPGYAMQQIIDGTRVGLDFAKRAGALFIKFSTSEVYNRADALLCEQTPAIVNPEYDARSEYQIGFIAAEQLCFTHPHDKVVVLRLFNVVGPGQMVESGCVLPRFCYAALSEEPLTVYGNGKQRRAFLHVQDLVDFCTKLTYRDSKEIWNVANPDNVIDMASLAALVKKRSNSSSKISHVPAFHRYYRDGVEKADISIFKAIYGLGWTPKIKLTRIVDECLKSMRAL